MKKLCVCVLMLCLVGEWCEGRDSLVTVFWNLENFFDYVDGGIGDSDREFSAYGSRHWTRKKFQAKCDAVAKSLFWIGEKYGRMPDVIGLAEIENRGVLYKLLDSTPLRKFDYRIVHYDSGDRRGIDVALLYRADEFRLVSKSVTVPEFEGVRLATRDILQVCLEDSKGQTVNLIVNHHPSKYGGASASEGRRNAAMHTLRHICDSLMNIGQSHIIAMGDFNDTPDAAQFRLLDGALINMSDSLHKAGQGTIRYEGRWDLIDMFLVTPSLAAASRTEILQVPFLMTYEKKYPGLKPLRTYSGPRYIGGVSDHCPIVLLLSTVL